MAGPCSVDSTPTSANQEDHVSMACHAARRLFEMNRNLEQILGIELLCAAQGIEYRAPIKTSPILAGVIARLRQDVATMGTDRYMAPDLEKGAELVASGELISILDDELFPKLERAL